MMTLYFHNFRGFERTTLPLRRTNFLVGENSTGKTSVLAALQILSEAEFWFTGRFSSKHVDLGTFSDIARPGTKYFQVGVATTQPRPSITLFTFAPGRGTLEPCSMRMHRNDEYLELVRK